MSGQQNQTLQGYIVALPKSGGKDDGFRVAVQTEDGTEYHVIPKGMGMDLAHHVNVGVEVTGQVQENDETFLVMVRSYKLQDEYDDEWYDDDDA